MGNSCATPHPFVTCTQNSITSTCCNKQSQPKNKEAKYIELYGWKYPFTSTKIEWFVTEDSCMTHAAARAGKKEYFIWRIRI